VKILNIHRIKPDGSDYADIITVSKVKRIHDISALAINWIDGRISLIFYTRLAEFSSDKNTIKF